jgi:serine/threonine protein kinase
MALKKKKTLNQGLKDLTEGKLELNRNRSNTQVEEFKARSLGNENSKSVVVAQSTQNARDEVLENNDDNLWKKKNEETNKDYENDSNKNCIIQIPTQNYDDNSGGDGTSSSLAKHRPPFRIESCAAAGHASNAKPSDATANLVKSVGFARLPVVQNHRTRLVWGLRSHEMSYRSCVPGSVYTPLPISSVAPPPIAQSEHQQGSPSRQEQPNEEQTLEFVEDKLHALRQVIASQATPHKRMLVQLQRLESRRAQLTGTAEEDDDTQEQDCENDCDDDDDDDDDDDAWIVMSESSQGEQQQQQSLSAGMSLTSVGLIDAVMLAQVSFGGLSLLGDEDHDNDDHHAIAQAANHTHVQQEQQQRQVQQQQVNTVGQAAVPWHPRPAFSVPGLKPSLAERMDLPCELRPGTGVRENTKILYNAASHTYIAMPSRMPKHVNRFGGVRKVFKCDLVTSKGGPFLRPVEETETEPRAYALKWYYKSKLMEYAGKCMEDPRFEIEALLYLFMEGHTHVLPLHGLWEDEERIYVLSKYMPRGSVHDYLSSTHLVNPAAAQQQSQSSNSNGNRRQVSPWSFQEKLYVFRNMLLAISQCHKRGIVHLDISCENFVLANDFTPFLIDFGLATTIEAANSGIRPRVVGKRQYMAPECWDETMSYDACLVDAWAVSVCLVMLLTNGAAPFGNHVLTSELYLQVAVRRDRQALEAMLDVATPVAVVDLLFAAFNEDPGARIGCDEMLRHPMFQMHTNF